MNTRHQILFIVLLTFIQNFCFSQSNVRPYDAKIANDFNRLYGKTFEAIELEDANGNMVRTDSLKGKTIYVEFWFTACPPCIKEIPHAKMLQQFFANDTNVVFVNICIENLDRKPTWQKMVKEKEMTSIQLFYARNRPQKINLLREFFIDDFPTCLLINDQQKVIGYHAPSPSQTGWVHWAITQALANVPLAEAYRQMAMHDMAYDKFISEKKNTFSANQTTQ